MREEYLPKGSMCMLCEHRHEDCSVLDFKSMRPLFELSDGTVVVKCDSFERSEVKLLDDAEKRVSNNRRDTAP